MKDNYLTQAIRKLHPEAEFSYSNNDYTTIKWDVLNGDAPTQAEIDAEIKEIKAEEKAAEKKAEADKATAQSKLAALGLTADDLKALGL
jgi:hypothetical protein